MQSCKVNVTVEFVFLLTSGGGGWLVFVFVTQYMCIWHVMLHRFLYVALLFTMTVHFLFFYSVECIIQQPEIHT